MTFELRLVVIALASFAASGTIVALAIWLWTSRRGTDPVTDPPLFFTRLLPSLAGASAMTLAMLGFGLFEHRGEEETGLILRSLAILGSALLLSAAWRAWELHRRTRRTLNQWMSSAEPVSMSGTDIPIFAIDATFPIVAVVGLFRQRIIIARSVLERCAPEELRAILAHERIHIDRHDNVRRAIFSAAPDVLSWLPISDRLIAAWHDSCEEAADNGADRLGERGRVLLAQALIRVARLAPVPPAVHDLPASALYRGEDLNRRIHRLLAPPVAVAIPSRRLRYAVAIGMTGAILAIKPIHRSRRDRGEVASLTDACNRDLVTISKS